MRQVKEQLDRIRTRKCSAPKVPTAYKHESHQNRIADWADESGPKEQIA